MSFYKIKDLEHYFKAYKKSVKDAHILFFITRRKVYFE